MITQSLACGWNIPKPEQLRIAGRWKRVRLYEDEAMHYTHRRKFSDGSIEVFYSREGAWVNDSVQWHEASWLPTDTTPDGPRSDGKLFAETKCPKCGKSASINVDSEEAICTNIYCDVRRFTTDRVKPGESPASTAATRHAEDLEAMAVMLDAEKPLLSAAKWIRDNAFASTQRYEMIAEIGSLKKQLADHAKRHGEKDALIKILESQIEDAQNNCKELQKQLAESERIRDEAVNKYVKTVSVCVSYVEKVTSLETEVESLAKQLAEAKKDSELINTADEMLKRDIGFGPFKDILVCVSKGGIVEITATNRTPKADELTSPHLRTALRSAIDAAKSQAEGSGER